MDVISLGKARVVKAINDRSEKKMGATPEEGASDVAERVSKIEDMDPKTGLIRKIGVLAGHTAVNLNKHNLRMQMLLDLGRSGLKDSIVDTFKETSSIDESNSEGWVHLNGAIEVEEGIDRATVVLEEEQANHAVNIIFVSKAGLATAQKTIPLELEGGSGEAIALTDGAIRLVEAEGEFPSASIYWTDWLSLEGVAMIRSAKTNSLLNGGDVSFLIKKEDEAVIELDGQKDVSVTGLIQVGVRLSALTEEVADRLTNGVHEGLVQDGEEYILPMGESDLSMVVNLQSEAIFSDEEIMRIRSKEYTLFGSYDERKVL